MNPRDSTRLYDGLDLLPQHAELLARSAIDPEVARERGYRSVRSAIDLRRLGFSEVQARTPALLVPIYGVGGGVVSYQARPDKPRVSPKGRIVKYETPKGSGMVLDVPPRVRGLLGDPRVALWITEGVRKADSAVSAECVCIDLLGVWNWRGKNGEGGKTALPDWESVAFRGKDLSRRVYLSFDSDVVQKQGVHDALMRLSRFLESRGATVTFAIPAPGPGGAKVGLDDYLAAGGTIEALRGAAVASLPLAVDSDVLRFEPYCIRRDGIFLVVMRDEEEQETRLANFSARIVAEVARDDGVETRRAFELVARLDGREEEICLPASEFDEMRWPIVHLGAKAIVTPGAAHREHVRTAIQLASSGCERRRVYTHTGWRRVEGRVLFLHAGGAIGPEGLDPAIRVEPPEPLRHYRLPEPPEGAALREAAGEVFRLAGSGPARILYPAVGAVLRAPIGTVRFSLFLYGPTGTFKTETAMVLASFFGTGVAASEPLGWSSTANAIEGIASAAKDIPLVVDDFVPQGTAQDVARKHQEADRVLRGQGNRTGRSRLRSDGQPLPTRHPRGMILATGEELPRGHSLNARLVPIEIRRGDIQASALTEWQAAARLGVYARAIAAYLRWLAPRIEEVRRAIDVRVAVLRAEFAALGHPRAASNLAEIAAGFETFVRFSEECGALSPDDAAKEGRRMRDALLECASGVKRELTEEDPVPRFFDLLRAALTAGAAHVAARDGGMSPDARRWGWREGVRGDPTLPLQPMGRRIGWVDGEHLYLERGAAYAVIHEWSARAGNPFPLSEKVLPRRLEERRLLASVDATRRRLTVRRSTEGVMREVLHLLVAVLFTGAEVDVPAGELDGREEHRPPEPSSHSPLPGQEDGPTGRNGRSDPGGEVSREATPARPPTTAGGPHCMASSSKHRPVRPLRPVKPDSPPPGLRVALDVSPSGDAPSVQFVQSGPADATGTSPPTAPTPVEECEERAAILEFDAGIPHEEAERGAR